MCYRQVVDYEALAVAIVKNPFDKYTVLRPHGMEYNYFMLDNLMNNMTSPYDRFTVKIHKEKLPQYRGMSRNDECPCGSGRKYKKCCLGSAREQMDHYRINYHDNPYVKPVDSVIGGTWLQD